LKVIPLYNKTPVLVAFTVRFRLLDENLFKAICTIKPSLEKTPKVEKRTQGQEVKFHEIKIGD
jgi:hypothetical protein